MPITSRLFTLKNPWQRKSEPTTTQEPANTKPSGEDFIIAARICIKQSKLLEAQDILKQGLSSGSKHHTQHIQLQKEMTAVSATIRRYNHQLYRIPREVWDKVFQDIPEQPDLIHCAAAFTPWSDAIINMMPDLWSPPWCIKRQGRPVSVFDTKLSTIRIDEPGFYNPDPTDTRWLEGLFDGLSRRSNNTFETLAIEFLVITSPLICYIAKALGSIDPPLKRLVFRPEGTLNHMDVKKILDSSSRVEDILFECTLRDYRITSDLISVELSALTHLKLIFRNFDGMALMSQVIRQCPALVHLLVCAEIYKRHDSAKKKVYTTYYKACIEQAFEHCPQLKILQIADYPWFWRYERQKLFLLDDYDYGLAETKGIHTLNYSYWWKPVDLRFIADKLRNSLESLCLSYKFYQANRTDSLPLLPLYGAPSIRRVAFEMVLHFGKKEKPSIVLLDDMIAFFSAAPTLEEIVLNISFWNTGRAGTGQTDAFAIQEKVRNVLLTIARNCRLLRAITLAGCSYLYTDDVLLEFASEAGSDLTHLEATMPTAVAERMKKILPKLVYIKILESEAKPAVSQKNNIHFWPYVENTLNM